MSGFVADRAIGTGAVGLGRPNPSPGARAICIVNIESTWADGAVTHETQTHVWDGYTAATALAERLKDLRNAHRPFDLIAGGFVIRRDVGGWVEVEQITFTDETSLNRGDES